MRESAGIPFGSYTLIRRLARGGMAEVFLARQRGPEGFDRRVAVKRILPHLVDSADFVGMFLNEARLAAELSHPNVVHIYEFGKVDEHYFIAMEFVDGVHAGALVKRAGQERLPPALVARIGADACAGLHYGHHLEDAYGRALHVVHRDVSPPNLMLSYDGTVKLVDFGIAKAVSQVEQTRPGVVKGKWAYMSPEQTTGNRLDGRSDVFSLGLVLWELLAGRLAVSREDPVEGMRAIRDGRIPPIESVRPDTPPALAAAIGMALMRDPEDRASAAELGLALESFIKSSAELGTSLELSQWLRAKFPRQASAAPRGAGKAARRRPGTVPATAPATAATGAGPLATEPAHTEASGSVAIATAAGREGTAATTPERGAHRIASRPAAASPVSARADAPARSHGAEPDDRSRPPQTAGQTAGPPAARSGRRATTVAHRKAPRVRPPTLPEPRPARAPAGEVSLRPATPAPPLPAHPVVRAESPRALGRVGQRTRQPTVPGRRARGTSPPRTTDGVGVPAAHHTGLVSQLPLPPAATTSALAALTPADGDETPSTAPTERREAAPPRMAQATDRPDPRSSTYEIRRQRGGVRVLGVAVVVAAVAGGVALAMHVFDRGPGPTAAIAAGAAHAEQDDAPAADRGDRRDHDTARAGARPVTAPLDARAASESAGDAPPTAPAAAPAPLPRSAELMVLTTPPGARVQVGDGPSVTTPARFSALSGGRHRVRISLEGHTGFERELLLRAGEHRTFEVSLAPVVARADEPAPRRRAPKKAARRVRSAPAPRAAAPAPGRLTVRTAPYSEVFLGSRKLGVTPFANVELPAGTHILTFRNPERGATRKRVVVAPGQTTKLNFQLP